jgi:hypothetical protein
MDDDSDYDFEGFDEDDLILNRQNHDNDSDIEVSDFDSDDDDDVLGGDPLPDDWTRDLHDVLVQDFIDLGPIGPLHNLTGEALALDYFHLIWGTEIYNILVRETNRYANQRQDEAGAHDKYWTDVTVNEMKAYISINITMGIHSLPEQIQYWSEDPSLGVDAVRKLMQKNRLKKISQYLHTNDNSMAIPYGQPGHDRLHKVRPLLHILTGNFRWCYKPHRELSIDEAMVGFKGCISNIGEGRENNR